MKRLRTIEDLESFSDVRKMLKKVWDPSHEIDDWHDQARIVGQSWESTHTWNSPRSVGNIHSSSITYSCDNFLLLELKGTPRVVKSMGKTAATFDMGTAIHLMMDYLTTSRSIYYNYDHVNELPIHEYDKAKDLHICGHADGMEDRIVSDISLRVILEYKSCSSEFFSRLRSTPPKKTVRQVHAYMWATNIPISVVIYINKCNENKKSFIIPYDKKVWEPMEARVRKIIDLYEKGEIAQKHINNSCSYCDFFEECNPYEEKEKWKKNIRRKTIVNPNKRGK